MTATRSQASPALAARGLVKRFGDVLAVDGLDLEILRGECFGLLGPNGAGKTTTIEMLEGLTRPDAGEIVVLGQNWNRHERALRERLGVAVALGALSHNDSGCSVANSLAAVSAGVVQVQGCINGLGERTGNANLSQVIPNLMLKMGVDCIPLERLERLLRDARHRSVFGDPAAAHRSGYPQRRNAPF